MPTRLATRLLASYSLLAGSLLLAFLLAVMGLLRIDDLLGELTDHDLVDMEAEETLHRTAWTIEVEARRGLVACEQDPGSGPDVSARIAGARAQVERALATSGVRGHPRMRKAVEGYVAFARSIEADPRCEALARHPMRQHRLELDEELTNAWVERLGALRRVILGKEQEVRRISEDAFRRGAVIGALALLLASALALGLSRNVATSMAELSRQARRVGEGDFTPLPALHGPWEVRTLAIELDRMRARLAELDQLKQAFIASVSHDLRTPLTRVREALGLLADESAGPLTDCQARVVALARAACEREIRLVTSLLDLSRIRSGKPLRREAGASIDRVVEVVLDDLREEAAEQGVTLAFDREGAMPMSSLDGALVERALANLVSNAISVSARGKAVRIERAFDAAGPPQAAAHAPGWIRVIVRDEGPGVPADVRPRIFKPFSSYDVGGGRERRGVGLGLSIAREMVRAHGGDVALLDLPGRGATFGLWIPLDERPGGDGARTSPQPATSTPS